MADPVSNPLTLIMTSKSPASHQALKDMIDGFQKDPTDNPIRKALTALRMVHFARFVFLSDTQLAIITTYDGDFDLYIDAFVNAIGKVFDALFAHIHDAPPVPVSNHRAEFLAYIKKHDKPSASFYSAYPDLKVLDILTLQKNQSGS